MRATWLVFNFIYDHFEASSVLHLFSRHSLIVQEKKYRYQLDIRLKKTIRDDNYGCEQVRQQLGNGKKIQIVHTTSLLICWKPNLATLFRSSPFWWKPALISSRFLNRGRKEKRYRNKAFNLFLFLFPTLKIIVTFAVFPTPAIMNSYSFPPPSSRSTLRPDILGIYV